MLVFRVATSAALRQRRIFGSHRRGHIDSPRGHSGPKSGFYLKERSMGAITSFFSPYGFMPHGFCYSWNGGLVWLHVVSDALIFLSYMSIPVTLVYFVRKRRDIAFSWMFFCFGAFIIACGMTHAMEIWTLWR